MDTYKGMHIKSEPKVGRDGFQTVKTGSSIRWVPLSYLHRMEQNELSVIDDCSKKINETGKSQGLRNTEVI